MADGESVEREVAGSFSEAQLEAIAGVVQWLLDKALSEHGSRKSSGPASDERGAADKSSDATPGQLGALPLLDKVGSLELPEMGETLGQQSTAGEGGRLNPFASIIPLLASLPGPPEAGDKAEAKPVRYMYFVEKGLPTLPMKLVERVWNLEYVDMEEFLPAPRSLRIAEQERSSSSLQESLVGAFSQFQAMQQHKAQRQVTDIITWTRCFSLYMAVLSKRSPEMAPSMVAHLHTVLRLQQRASSQLAWLEYDIQFQMELAASADRAWTCGDPWQYISCLPGPSSMGDPFEMSAEDPQQFQWPGAGKGK